MKKFGKFLLLYTAAFLILGSILLAVFYSYIAAYERSQPEAYIREYAESGAPAALLACSPRTNDKLSDAEFLEDLFRRAEFSKISDTEYSIRVSDKELGYISLKQTPGKFGMVSWQINEEAYDIGPWLQYTELSVPEGFSVYVNSSPLGEDFIINPDAPYELFEGIYEDYPWLPRLKTYQSAAHLGPAEIEVHAVDGSLLSDYSQKSFLTNCDAETEKKISEFCEEYFYRYMVFVGNVDGETNKNYTYLKSLIKNGGQLQRLMGQTKRILYYANTTAWELLDVELLLCSDLGNDRYFADVCYRTEITALGAPDTADNYARLILFMDDKGDISCEAMYNYNI